jgi:hypothetical protein
MVKFFLETENFISLLSLLCVCFSVIQQICNHMREIFMFEKKDNVTLLLNSST